jgi:DNA-directed RNA polymerase specialized sigma subunit
MEPGDAPATPGRTSRRHARRDDPATNTSFVPFAVASVVGELKRYLRDTSWRLHVPRPRKAQVLRLYRVADELHQTLGRSPTTSELADGLRLLRRALARMRAQLVEP